MPVVELEHAEMLDAVPWPRRGITGDPLDRVRDGILSTNLKGPLANEVALLTALAEDLAYAVLAARRRQHQPGG